MNTVAVLQREMRACVRQPFTYWLRIVGVACLLFACAYGFLIRGARDFKGPQFFAFVHAASFVCAWVVVPLLTADCISRERREGTLPLLFLTWLSPIQVVGAKSVVNISRAFSLWIAVVPVATIAFLMGGVSWKDVAISSAINFSSMMLALAAGLLASALSWRWGRAMGLAAGLSSILFSCFIPLNALAIQMSLRPFVPGLTASTDVPFSELLAFTMDGGGLWSTALSSLPRRAQQALVFSEGVTALVSFIVFWIIIRVTARIVARNWRIQHRSVIAEKAEQVFCRPILGKRLLNAWMKWHLNSNPVGWLEQRSWAGRIVSWVWMGALVLVYSFIVSASFSDRSFVQLQGVIMLGLIISLAASAAGSFRRERESGVLELLLISPIGEWKLISGRIRALWTQFAPAFGLILGLWLYWDWNFKQRETPMAIRIFSYCVNYFAVPAIGLYYSLTRRSFVAAFIWTMAVAELAPLIIGAVNYIGYFPFRGVWRVYGYVPRLLAESRVTFLLAGIQLALASLFAVLLRAELRSRRFALRGD